MSYMYSMVISNDIIMQVCLCRTKQFKCKATSVERPVDAGGCEQGASRGHIVGSR